MSAKTAEARGKFLFIGPEKYLVRGVSYGTFEPDGGGSQFPESDRVARDFAAMRNCGINTIRTYTGPPPARS
jgi:beta-galactosidase/beta-glucuronidase